MTNSSNTSHIKDKNDNQNENKVAEYGNRQKKTFKNNTNNSW
ncbi:hypothetical protein [Fructilactobacillus sanfranciscensis]|nr:hypothetical protein [Fructilactobacillus sanfranciscensis]